MCLNALTELSVLIVDLTRYIVVDGTIITTDEIILNGTGHIADVHLMMGNMRDDGAAFIGYPVCASTVLASHS